MLLLAPLPNPPLLGNRKLSDFLRCGSCQRTEWHDGYGKLLCRPRQLFVDPVKNYCAWHLNTQEGAPMSELLDLSTKRESAPAKAWRNLWWLDETIWIRGDARGPGQVWSKFTWPSRDVAESKAVENEAERRASYGDNHEYLGAFPCERESPP